MRAQPVLWAVMLAALTSACMERDALEVRTFNLQHLDPEAASILIGPYVFTDRPDAPGRLSFSREPQAVTVRETRDNLEKIARVLEEYDRPRAGVALHFQIIEADGAPSADPAIADVEAALRKLFRFEGYRLVGEAYVRASSPGFFEQTVAGRELAYSIEGEVREVRAQGETETVRMSVRLSGGGEQTLLTTTVVAPLQQTIVLGSGPPHPKLGTLILTVRAERVGG